MLVLLLLAGRVAVAEDTRIEVALGSQRIVGVSGKINRLTSGPDIFDARTVGANELLILGVSEGQGTLVVWLEGNKRVSFLVSVVKRDPAALLEKVKAELGAVEGVSFRIVGSEVFVDGCATTSDGNKKALSVLRRFPEITNVTICDFVVLNTETKLLMGEPCRVEVVDRTPHMNGDRLSPEDTAKLKRVLEGFPTLRPDTPELRKLKQELADDGVFVDIINGKVFTRGWGPDTKAAARRVERLMERLYRLVEPPRSKCAAPAP